jgi:hypothetical protein
VLLVEIRKNRLKTTGDVCQKKFYRNVPIIDCLWQSLSNWLRNYIPVIVLAPLNSSLDTLSSQRWRHSKAAYTVLFLQ